MNPAINFGVGGAFIVAGIIFSFFKTTRKYRFYSIGFGIGFASGGFI